MDEQDKLYAQQMKSWIKEHEAIIKQIQVTIETSEEIAEQNRIQLSFQLKSYELGKKQHEEWLAGFGPDGDSNG